MRKATFNLVDSSRLILSIITIYFLAPSADRCLAVLISGGFAVLNIFVSDPIFKPRQVVKYVLYIGISIFTYHILLSDWPWNLSFGGLLDSSLAPLMTCSLIMTLAGWLLLPTHKMRMLYVVITLGVQAPLAFFVGTETLEFLFSDLARSFYYVDNYSGSWQFWQFQWMLTYHLPFFFLPRFFNRGIPLGKSARPGW